MLLNRAAVGCYVIFKYAPALLLVVLLSGCDDLVTSHYATYQDAIDDDLFERGWLPDILPQTAINIKTTNNLDLNTSSGYFDIPGSDLAVFTSRLTKMPNGRYSYNYGSAEKDPVWVFEIDGDTGNVTYVLSAD